MNEIPFEQWFDIFVDECRSLGYTGPICASTFELEYNIGSAPETAAINFVSEMAQ